MTITAAFIGINKHKDQEIRDLTGAARDALTLYSLFKDSIPNINISLLTDEDASLANIRTALYNTLLNATHSDTIILSFSGHGTNNHRRLAMILM